MQKGSNHGNLPSSVAKESMGLRTALKAFYFWPSPSVSMGGPSLPTSFCSSADLGEGFLHLYRESEREGWRRLQGGQRRSA